ncbi:hypothetical protein A3F03_02240 [Candidatus Roizmanbacteria bacterium RIFCSPHIGHO2_12_FULL_41_11]|uniref:HD domain-containing protein n=2 Tax=Candidatus Roizmaniibacteriota TaxID=1752723 RepID=A0A1F7J8E3_9BACT|nr:MAG: hypothetical protein A3F03_02240 [Candidatus Roizmanbacteria bacterium RIFCSPHIGHO2_12_FULL_41_11]OGK51871.1 MAG: hypothetical protein A2966_00640 [Candidatus Roizmanbacteria bacterium RIFCSPLOWO2_01_FULL_41_22]
MTKLPVFVTDFLKVFQKDGFQIYVVGGAVRHLLLEEPVSNWDFTTNATPDQILQIFPDGFYNNQFGTVGIPQKIDADDFVFEVTTFRRESNYGNKRHPEKIEWSDDLKEDLARRDFTISAIAYDGKNIIDPFFGRQDLEKKLIVAVGDPDKRFGEDALRLMRAVRLASQLGFMIEEKTREAISKNAPLIKHVSWERIREEFFKILSSKHPAEGVLFLRTSQLLKYILPELDVCFAIQQKSPLRHHVYDVGTHLVMSLKHCPSDDVITRFATLIHDIGKAKTYRKDPTSQLITFFNHEVVGTKQALEIAERFRLSNKEKDRLVLLVKYHQFTVSELQTDKAVRRFIREVGKNNLENMLALRTGDRLGSGAKPTSWRYELFKKRLIEVQKEPFKVTDLKIDGHDVMRTLGVKPGPQVGAILKRVFEEVVEDKIKNDRSKLLSRIKQFPKNA